MTHAKRSPSGFNTWGNCPGSTAFVDELIEAGKTPKKEEASVFASEGTAAHELAEKCLIQSKNPAEFMNDVLEADHNLFTVDDDMVYNVDNYVEYVKKLKLDKMFVEVKLPLFYSPTETGTADVIGIKGRTLHVVDLKYGKGVAVVAEGNMQLLIYGICAYDEYDMLYDIDKVVVHIVQPRMGSYTSEEYGLEEVETHRGLIEECFERSVKADNLPENLISREKSCRWCRAKPFCGEHRTTALGPVEDMFNDLDASSGEITEDQLKVIFEQGPQIKKFIDAVFKRLEDEAKQGTERPWCKLVAGRSSRKWNAPEEDIIKALRVRLTLQEIYPPKLISPAQVEKVMKKKKCKKKFTESVNSFILKTEGTAKLAPVSDKRPAVIENSEFEVLE